MARATRLRRAMVDRQIVARGITDARLLAAMRAIPREAFVADRLAGFAYEDCPLPIEAGQTISQPYIVAHMIEAAGIGASDHVLEVGAGSGYAAAVMSRIALNVHAIERHEVLARSARERLESMGCDNVEIRTGDGSNGWPEAAPFDAIIVSAGAPGPPQPLCDQLATGGRLVLPLGPSEEQRLIRITRNGVDGYDREDLGAVRFVPLIGAHGWAADQKAGTR